MINLRSSNHSYYLYFLVNILHILQNAFVELFKDWVENKFSITIIKDGHLIVFFRLQKLLVRGFNCFNVFTGKKIHYFLWNFIDDNIWLSLQNSFRPNFEELAVKTLNVSITFEIPMGFVIRLQTFRKSSIKVIKPTLFVGLLLKNVMLLLFFLTIALLYRCFKFLFRFNHLIKLFCNTALAIHD